MTTKTKTIQDLRADEVYKIIAGVGFLLNSLNQLDHLYDDYKQKVFRGGLKYSLKQMKAELEKAERVITDGEVKINEVMAQQMADSYTAIDTIVTLMLEGGRILTPEAMVLMNDDMVATAAKWGIKLEER